MIPRKIIKEELQAITTLIQYSDNIGTEVFTEKQISTAVTRAFKQREFERAKDVDFKWMISLITDAYSILCNNIRTIDDIIGAGFPPSTEKAPTIQELPTEEIYSIIAHTNTDDTLGELLDELESRHANHTA